MTTPAKRFDGFLKLAAESKREISTLDKQISAHKQDINEYENRALEILRDELGFDEGDVARDEFGSMYRVTDISMPRLYWSDLSDAPGYMKTLNRIRVKGLLLNKNGVPTWQKDRTLHGKLKKYDPEAGQ